MNAQDEKYMQVALRLGRRGIGSVEPNPAVGCIIVKGNQIVGRAWHRKFGGPHAEISALEDTNNLGVNPQGSAMYVTLEPCCHHGKTPPCTHAIIQAGCSRVVVATIDPSKHARGKGIEQLREAGIEVATGVCEMQARLLNAPLIKFALTGRPWTILKWAQSIDGKLAWAQRPGENRWISSDFSRKDAHRLRRRAQAILVGIGTVLADDPLLTPRPAGGKKPIRIVLDSHLRIPLKSKLLATAKRTPVLILTSRLAVQTNLQTAQTIQKTGAEVLAFDDSKAPSNLHFLIDELSKRDVQQLLVEGGPTVIGSFLNEHIVDEVRVYIAPKLLGGKGCADISQPIAGLDEALELQCVELRRFGEDICLSGFSRKALEQISAHRAQS
jgi:diaminohydroxyphosphoribosylaminopyrimidine deaminase/5-amino-6-(5-phosphoribosylamino)uracil reductase